MKDHFLIPGLQLWRWRSTAKNQSIAHDISPNEVDWLLQELAGVDRLFLRLQPDQPIPSNVSFSALDRAWQQRIAERTPVQYLAGIAPWRNFELKVAPGVLIPRPETELLIDFAIAQDSRLKAGQWVDLGTGSGAIAIGLALSLPSATVHAVDRSEEALAIAKSNAESLNAKIQFYQGNWFEPITHLKHSLSGVVSNPPYIPTETVSTLEPEVRLHEPHLALDGGTDGLESIRHLIQTAPDYLISGGVWMIEMMMGQADTIAALLSAQGSYDRITIHKDLAGIERFAIAYRK
ncbi:peptide chain release factor N(5)-glutamine methyltransferase [Leptolyngbya sp. FACHB-17]|uniref:peptide chain release factor N(5)-glutamine methyltransferase n=1 Tax=unclassified Leptolyngbya TaxID=2650499 RepID=UPI00168028ED|nr:peptide chain release factor N(5)-glutamine methyltransferase [Leptolyngbya sp. FACHB-17]MBD2080860.1 peptide chain release factor N(5)-glutamine methyltransferase [Leptolyngbya sp. FACHB-17]